MIPKSDRQREREARHQAGQAEREEAVAVAAAKRKVVRVYNAETDEITERPAAEFAPARDVSVSRLRLSRHQRRALFNGEHPRIVLARSEFCPPVGYVCELSAQVSLEVTGVTPTLEANLLHYTVRDDRPRRLRQSTHDQDFEAMRRSHDEHGQPAPVDAETEAIASEQSNYTSSPLAAMRDEPEAVSREDQEAMSADADEKRLAEWDETKAELAAVIAKAKDGPASGRFASRWKYVERQIDELDQRIRKQR